MAGAVMRAGGRLGRISPQSAALFLCDMQEKFRPNIRHFEPVVQTSRRLLQAATLLDVPVVVTEQYPKGLGRTVKELGIEEYGLTPFEKTQFSMCIPDVESILKDKENVNAVLLCGIETHACIQHTTQDLLDRGYDVHVIVDACASRSQVDRLYAFERMRQMGAFLTTSECAILGLAPNSAHPKFRQIQKIIWTPAPDSGLLTSASP